MDNLYTVIHLPVADVLKLIPAGTVLSEQNIAPTDHHPVFIFFTHNKFGQPPEPAHIHYREMLVGVPFVECLREDIPYKGPYTYMPRLYINQDDPRVFGNTQFGYEKLAAEISDDGCGHVEVRTLVDGCLIASAKAVLAGEPVHPSEIDQFAIHADLFHQPLLTQAARRSDPDVFASGEEDEFLVSWIDYDFDHPTSRATPIEISVEIGHLFTPAAFPKGMAPAAPQPASWRIEVRQHVHQAVPVVEFRGKA